MFRNVETKDYLCTDKTILIWQQDLVMLEEAQEFILNLPKAAMKKVLDNVHRIAEGERNAIIFSKLEGTEIWEFRTLYDKVKYRLFAFLGYADGHADSCYTRHCQENSENAKERDC